MSNGVASGNYNRINEAGAKYFVQYPTRLSLFALHGIVRKVSALWLSNNKNGNCQYNLYVNSQLGLKNSQHLLALIK